MHLRALRTRAGERTADPVFWTNVIQTAKTVLAATAAWVLAVNVFELPQPFLAPWAALLVVHATVYRTFSRGAQQVGAAVLGVLLAWAVGNTLGPDPVAVAVVLLVGLTLGEAKWFRDEVTTIAATALIVLTTGFSDDDIVLASRLADTAVGIVVGLLVNALVWPPLRRRTAVLAMDHIDDEVGRLLADMADQIEVPTESATVTEWVDRTNDLDTSIDEAWALVRQARESARLNPRRKALAMSRSEDWDHLLRRLEQAVADTRSMAQTLGQSVDHIAEWDEQFRQRWVGLLGQAGAAISAADAAGTRTVHRALADLAEDLSTENLSEQHWPQYGALIINLRNIVEAMDEVAQSNPMTPPPRGPLAHR